MPHTRQPPNTLNDILATSEHDPEWTAIQEKSPLPTGKDWGSDVKVLKQMSEAMLPRLRASLDASRPKDIMERDINIDIPSTEIKPDGGGIRVLLCQPAKLDKTADNPIIILYHGGGHTVGNPESEIPLARLLVQQFHAVVILPAYRLAPEHKFPSSFSDSLEVLKIVVNDIILLKQQQTATDSTPSTQSHLLILDPLTNPSSSLTIGGTSAGATIAASVNHLYRKYRTSILAPDPSDPLPLSPLTSLFLSCGSCINALSMNSGNMPLFRSRTQNANEPPIDEDMYALFQSAAQIDQNNPIWSSFDQNPDLSGSRHGVADDHIWMAGTDDEGQPPMRVYFQVCGADMARDDGLIYERVLREVCKVRTRMDLYAGFGHVFWGMGGAYPEMEMSLRRMRDSVEGVGWLLGREFG